MDETGWQSCQSRVTEMTDTILILLPFEILFSRQPYHPECAQSHLKCSLKKKKKNFFFLSGRKYFALPPHSMGCL